MSKKDNFTSVLQKLGISEEHTKKGRPYVFPHIKDVTFPKAGYNMMCDLLMLPETTKGFNYLFVLIDLWSNACDFEPIKNKTPEQTLDALKKIFKRGKYIKHIEATLRTDAGSEWKGVFAKYLYDQSILHRIATPDRHKQLASVESLNKLLGRAFMTYLENKTEELGKPYSNWTDIVDQVRVAINEYKHHPKDEDPRTYPIADININKEPKFSIGDVVYYPLEAPRDIYGEKFANGRFRMGDRRVSVSARKIVSILAYPSPNPWRYMLEHIPNTSYAEAELKLATGQAESTYVVKQIIGKKTEKKKVFYLVWWKGYLKKDATWEPKDALLRDGLKEYIDQYESEQKLKNK